MNDKSQNIRQAILDSLPIFAAYFPLGIVWGFLWEQAGFSPFWGILFSAGVYAGAVQFFALSLMSSGEPLLGLLLAVTPVAIRNGFYTLALLDKLPKAWLPRFYSAFALVDAPFAILISRPKEQVQTVSYTLPLLIVTQLYWVAGTALGVFSGGFIPDGIASFDFAVTALIVALAMDQIKKIGNFRPLIIATVSAAAAWVVFKENWLPVAIGICTLSLIFDTPKLEAK